MPATPPPAIYCYSKTGHTRRAAKWLAQHSGAEFIPIEVDRYRMPLFWMVRAIWDVGRLHVPPLRTGNVVPVARPWIVVAGPVWADQPAPPLRSVLRALSTSSSPIGLLTTCGRREESVKCVRSCEAELGRSFAARVNIQNAIEGTDEMDRLLLSFSNTMTTEAASGVA
ncbi:hypothetical protein [uncultured Tateyamaria sp.]|uniref:hypothetical protein n=1 Tax=Tateyamaria sp. 1078 TaxID=3417464 RepID=UPI002626C466|nr:hypothetical protein [uncultured Tateyamaria sp.]